ncbi:MAG: AI-2E family transporter [Rickettsiaceae bacterium]|nr:AI-2E family transporter [Rickettsiaceae bacterium]
MLSVKTDITAQKFFLAFSFCVFLYICMKATGIVGTFFTSFGVAYLLRPIADKIARGLGLQYYVAAIFVFVIFTSILLGLLIFLVPACASQLHGLIEKIPEFKLSIETKLLPSISRQLKWYIGNQGLSTLKSVIEDASTPNFEARDMAFLIVGYAISTINLLVMCLLFPVMLFFLLIDFPSTSKNVHSFFSKIGLKHLNTIIDEVDLLMSSFLKALFNVGAILAVFYSLFLSITGFEFAILFGIIFGFGAIIPFIGSTVTLLACMSVSILTHGISMQQFWILCIFSIAQVIDNSYLTPKLVGDRVGLHPAAIIFSVFVCSQLLGFAGLLLAVPIAGVVKIIFKKTILNHVH